jgi:hypothetical protein
VSDVGGASIAYLDSVKEQAGSLPHWKQYVNRLVAGEVSAFGRRYYDIAVQILMGAKSVSAESNVHE